MMMKTAGGPGLVSPIDYAERKKPMPRATLIAVSIVVLAHIGVGAALYYQKFELTPNETAPEPDAIKVTMDPLVKPPVPEPPKPDQPRPATNTIHQTPTPTTVTDTFVAETLSKPTGEPGPVINFSDAKPVEQPGTAVEPPRPPAVITRPQWASQPSAAQMSRAYPERALSNGESGSAALLCTVSAAGTLSNCSVTAETPSGRRFGNAAMGLTRYFRMQPGAVNGQAIDGAKVSFTVRFAAGE